MNMSKFTATFLICGLFLLTGCQTNPHRSPGGTVVGSTALGAGFGALIGLAAGDPGVGAAIGAGVGLLGGAIQADQDAQARDAHFHDSPPVYESEARPVVVYKSRAPREVVARRLLARALRSANEERSERLLKESLTEYRTPEAHTALGELLERQGNYSRAEREYERALDLDPDYRPARYRLSQLDG